MQIQSCVIITRHFLSFFLFFLAVGMLSGQLLLKGHRIDNENTDAKVDDCVACSWMVQVSIKVQTEHVVFEGICTIFEKLDSSIHLYSINLY